MIEAGLRPPHWCSGPPLPAARRIGFESHVVTVDGYDALAGVLDGHDGTELVRASGTVEHLREVKGRR